VKVDLSPCSNILLDDNSSNGLYRKTPVGVTTNNNNTKKTNQKKQMK